MKTLSAPKFATLALLLAVAAPAFADESFLGTALPAQVVSTVTPAYPYLQRHLAATAEVTVVMNVDAKGTVTGAKVVASNNPEFDATTLAAVRQWAFVPATRDGQPVETRVKQTFTFAVRDLPTVNTSTMIASNKKSAK